MKILMVCLGNICRSPLAHGILENKLGEGFFIDSAGTANYHEGKKADKRSIKTAKSHNIDISAQISRPIVKEDLENFDLIYCMDQENKKNVLAMANPQQKGKIKLILDELDEKGQGVPDPYHGDLEDFEHVYQLLDKVCQKIAEKLEKE